MPHTPEQEAILALAQGYRISAVITTFATLGIVDALGTEGLAAAELAQRIDVNPVALARLLQAGKILGLVVEHDGRWHSTSLGVSTLSSSSPRSLVHALQLHAAFVHRWLRLSKAVQLGHYSPGVHEEEIDPNWVRTFTLGLYELARNIADDIAATLVHILNGVDAPTILDLGGGHGEYSMALIRRLPTARAVIFDLPPVITITQELIENSGLTDRVSVQAGDFFVDPLPGNNDLVLVFGVLHSEPEVRARQLLNRVWSALQPGGWIALRHWNQDSLDTVLMDLHLLVSTEQGHVSTVEQLSTWLADSGFVDIATQAIPDLPNDMLILARRPHL